MAPMRLDRRLYKAFLLSMLLLSVLPAEKAFSQTTLDRLSIAERSDGMGFVARLHLSAAPDSFKVAHAGEHYIQVALRSEEHTSELQSRGHLVCRLLLEKKNQITGGT